MTLFRKIVCFWFVFGFCGNVVWGQCPPNQIAVLTSQAAIDNFGILYPNCTELRILIIGHYNTADTITINDNITDLNPLSQVAVIEDDLIITGNNSLTSLDGLDNLTSVGRYMIVRGNGLVNLSGLGNLAIVEYLNIRRNHNLSNLNGLSNLTLVERELKIVDNDNLSSLDGVDNLTDIFILILGSNNNLTSLNGLQNVTSLVSLTIVDNPILSICETPIICDYIFNGGLANFIHDNAPGCNDVTQIASACAFGIIQTDVFYDLNQNQIQDANEPNYYDYPISIENDLYYPQYEGLIFIEPGNYTTTFADVNPNWEITTDSTSYFLSLEPSEIETITFGIYPTQQISDIQPSVNPFFARCNDTITINVGTKNLGTTVASGTLWLTVDDEGPVANFIDQPDITLANTNTYGWYFTDLFPSQSLEQQVNIQVPGPPDFMLGDSLVYEAYVDFEDANGSQSTQAFIYETEVRCSYDPNDKLVNPNREGDYVLFEEDFIYTIRFQNTGNDVAYDVVIRDTLDANLDLTTFRLLGSSHANRLNTILDEDERTLTFEFRDIFLPDSTSNFEASQGYVNYLISPFDGLAEETPITNSAGIYFDLNPPVITNTTQSIMVSELPIVSTEIPDNSFDFNILPNPNTGIFTIQNIPNGIYQIHNTSGQIIQEGNMQNDLQIDISREAQGVYFISVTVDDATSVRRMVKM